MKKFIEKKFLFAAIIAIIPTLITVAASICYKSAVDEPWGCLPLILPCLPLAIFSDSMGWRESESWNFLISGTFIGWFVIGYSISLFLSKRK